MASGSIGTMGIILLLFSREPLLQTAETCPTGCELAFPVRAGPDWAVPRGAANRLATVMGCRNCSFVIIAVSCISPASCPHCRSLQFSTSTYAGTEF